MTPESRACTCELQEKAVEFDPKYTAGRALSASAFAAAGPVALRARGVARFRRQPAGNKRLPFGRRLEQQADAHQAIDRALEMRARSTTPAPGAPG